MALSIQNELQLQIPVMIWGYNQESLPSFICLEKANAKVEIEQLQQLLTNLVNSMSGTFDQERQKAIKARIDQLW